MRLFHHIRADFESVHFLFRHSKRGGRHSLGMFRQNHVFDGLSFRGKWLTL